MLAQVELDPSSVTAAVGLVFSLAGVAAITKKVVDYAAYVRNKDWDSVIKVGLAVVVAIALTFVLRETDYADGISVLGKALDTMNAWTIAFMGLAIGAITSWGVDWQKSRDNTRSSAVGSIVGTSEPEG